MVGHLLPPQGAQSPAGRPEARQSPFPLSFPSHCARLMADAGCLRGRAGSCHSGASTGPGNHALRQGGSIAQPGQTPGSQGQSQRARDGGLTPAPLGMCPPVPPSLRRAALHISPQIHGAGAHLPEEPTAQLRDSWWGFLEITVPSSLHLQAPATQAQPHGSRSRRPHRSAGGPCTTAGARFGSNPLAAGGE